jgi:hypothetical protein
MEAGFEPRCFELWKLSAKASLKLGSCSHRSQNKFAIDSGGHAEPTVRREPYGLQGGASLVFGLGIFVALFDVCASLRSWISIAHKEECTVDWWYA